MQQPNQVVRWCGRAASGLVVATVALAVAGLTGPAPRAGADAVDCAQAKCVALTFDDGPSPNTGRLLQILADNDAKATFFLIGNKVAGDPAAARQIAEAGMEVGSHTFDHLDMTTIPPPDVADQLSRANDALGDAIGVAPTLWRPAGGLTNDEVNEQAAELGLAGILWDVIGYDWINDADTAATREVLVDQVRPGSVVLLHDTVAPMVDLMAEFVPMLKANGYHLVTVTQLLGPRAPGSVYGGRENGAPANDVVDLPVRDG